MILLVGTKKLMENKLSIKFRHYIMANPPKLQCWFEMKDTRGKNSFPLREWKEEQRNFAESLKYSQKGVLIRTEGITGLPDYKYAYKEPTFVVIGYPQGIAIISADTLALQKSASLTWAKAKEISHTTIE